VRAQVFSDVDTAYAEVESNIALLKPYKAEVQRPGAAGARQPSPSPTNTAARRSMDFLNAQSDYRQVQLAYGN